MHDFRAAGFGDIVALTFPERLISVLGMLAGGFTFGMLIGNLSSVLTMSSMSTLEYR